MKKQNIFKRIFEAIAEPFVFLSVIIDEDRRSNLDGQYNKYWLKKNAREAKREARKAKREARKCESTKMSA